MQLGADLIEVVERARSVLALQQARPNLRSYPPAGSRYARGRGSAEDRFRLATYCAPARTLLESLELVSNSWHRTDLLDGLVGVWLPSGASLDSSRAGDGAGGYHWWSPDIEAGGFAVFHGPGDGRGPETLLEGARARGDVKIEADTLDDRGDVPVRRIVYRLQGVVPHVLIATPEGQRHHGGDALVELGDHLFFDAGGEHVRAGYQVREDAPAEVRETFAEVLARVEVGEP